MSTASLLSVVNIGHVVSSTTVLSVCGVFICIIFARGKVPKSLTATLFFDPLPAIAPSQAAAYRTYKKRYVSVSSLLPLTIIGMTYFFLRMNVLHGLEDGPVFAAGVWSGVASIYLSLIFIVGLVVQHVVDPDGAWGRFVRDVLSGSIEEGISVTGMVSIGLMLYARVRAGPCPDGTLLQAQSRCNPAAAVGGSGIPADHAMFYLFLPCLCPIMLRAIRFEMAVVSWAVCVSFVLLSLVHVNAVDWVFMLLMAMPLCFIVEIERLMRLSFINLGHMESRDRLDAEALQGAQEAAYQQELAVRERHQVQLASRSDRGLRLWLTRTPPTDLTLPPPHLTPPSPHLTPPPPHLTAPHLTSPHLTSPHLASPRPCVTQRTAARVADWQRGTRPQDPAAFLHDRHRVPALHADPGAPILLNTLK